MKKMYNMITYKSKVVHAEEDILNLSPIRQEINFYPSKYNNCGDDYSMVLLDDATRRSSDLSCVAY